MTYRINTTRQAAADRDRCFDYIAERSPDGALRWLEAHETKAASLLENPLRGLAPENPDHEEEICQRHFKTRHGLQYRLLYLVRDETMNILHVRGAGQDLMTPEELGRPEDR
jgi:plasmid stabilization system protein ParE